jgi:hypothetical protein
VGKLMIIPLFTLKYSKRFEEFGQRATLLKISKGAELESHFSDVWSIVGYVQTGGRALGMLEMKV